MLRLEGINGGSGRESISLRLLWAHLAEQENNIIVDVLAGVPLQVKKDCIRYIFEFARSDVSREALLQVELVTLFISAL